VLAVRLGRVQRVSFNLTDWTTTPRLIAVDGQPVRLGGFHSQHTHTLDVIGPHEPRITLLVIPPDTAQTTAHQVLMKASARDNTDNVGELLTPAATGPHLEIPDVAVARWEGDGGRVDEPVLTSGIPRQR
jgi:hypothetical protein